MPENVKMIITYIESSLKTLTWREWPTGLSHCGWIGRFLVQTTLGAQPGLGIQPHYEASGDLQVETWINAVLDIG